MIVEILDLVLDLVGDLAQLELLLRFGWPRARAWIARGCTQLARLGFTAFEQSEVDLDALAREAADQELLELLSRVSP
jgi:hypothetical protein